MFAKKPAGGGSNFDPLQQLTATKPAATGRELAQPQRDGPLLLRVVDDLAQAALKARNDFMTELNAADVQRRDVHAAAKARLEAELGQMAQTAAKLSDRLFFATRGMINLVRARCDPSSALQHCASSVRLSPRTGAAGGRSGVSAAGRRARSRTRRTASAAIPAAARGCRACANGRRRGSRSGVRQL